MSHERHTPRSPEFVRREFFTALLGASLLVGACSPAVNVKDDLFDIPRGQVRILSTLEELLNEPLDPSWRKSGANDPLSDYWSIPGDTCSYLFKGGFQSVVPGEMAIRYESYPEQHHPDSNRIVLTVIREREGKYSLPQCPVYLPLVSCIENHTLMLASRVECTLKDCIYEFVVFDYFEPIRILRDPPFLNRILRDFVQGFPKHYKYEIKHQTTGHFEPRPGAGSEYEMWSEYILFHVNLVDKTVKEAARHYGGFELLNVN